MRLFELKVGRKFTFVNKGLKYGVQNLDYMLNYKSCNNKIFKHLGHEQYIQIDSEGKEIGCIFNCYIWGRGENKKLYYEYVNLID